MTVDCPACDGGLESFSGGQCSTCSGTAKVAWSLADVEARAAAPKSTLRIPTSNERWALRGGDMVILVFKLDLPTEQDCAEKIPVIVRGCTTKAGELVRYGGEVAAEPRELGAFLKKGMRIGFEPRHVLRIESR